MKLPLQDVTTAAGETSPQSPREVSARRNRSGYMFVLPLLRIFALAERFDRVSL